MAELKTKVTNASVESFLNALKDENKRTDSFTLLNMLKKITKEEPRLWGNGTVGFGVFNYKSARSSQQGEWYLAGFAPRASNLTVYVMPGFNGYKKILDKLGKFKTGGGCLYINSLAEVDVKTLGELMEAGYHDIKKLIVENKSVFGETSLGPKTGGGKIKASATKTKTTKSTVKKATAKKTAAKKRATKKTSTKTKTSKRKK
ncbi:MAG TPA: hypothetical protein VD905_15405 [Flavobacteriales bacterium]|nr:hypothetical protein [Flavobacteriales bacterium]